MGGHTTNTAVLGGAGQLCWQWEQGPLSGILEVWVVLPGNQEEFSLCGGKTAQRVPCALPVSPE